MQPARDEQVVYWRDADEAHYAWQTFTPYIAATEAALLAEVRVDAGDRLLEIGCGEGANLHHLRHAGRGARLFGVDFSRSKVAFARRATGARVACADATALPFADGSFDAVLIRDLLHHVVDRGAVLAEARRVLRPGGWLTAIEPNGRNPMVMAQAALVREERAVLTSTAARLQAEMRAAGFVAVVGQRRQPLPVSRVVLHHRLGAPSLERLVWVRWLLRGVEATAERLLPAPLWAYIVCHGERDADAAG